MNSILNQAQPLIYMATIRRSLSQAGLCLLEGCREASDDYGSLRHDRRGRRRLHWLRGGIENIQDVNAIKNAFGLKVLQQFNYHAPAGQCKIIHLVPLSHLCVASMPRL